jgi:ribosome modulation factor
MANKFRVVTPPKSRAIKKPAAKAAGVDKTAKAKSKENEAKATAQGASKAGAEKSDGKKRTGRVLPDLLTNAELPKLKDFEHHFKTIKGLQEKAATANSLVRGAKKAAKQAGIDTQAIADAISYERQDPDAVRDYFRQLRATFQVAGVHVQLDMFNEGSISRKAQIFDEGYKAGQAGKSESDNPHDANTKAGQTWLAGYHAGQADLADAAFNSKDSLGDVKKDGTKAIAKAKENATPAKDDVEKPGATAH